jgi:hypothetical protein
MANLVEQIREWALSQGHADPVEAGQLNNRTIWVRNDADGAGDYIAGWNNVGWPQPSQAELDSVDGAADTRKTHEALMTQAYAMSLQGQVNVADPLGSVAPADSRRWERYLIERRTAWETEARSPTQSPNITGQLRAADGAERDWQEAEGLVVRKINANIYTTANDVATAAEWPP